MCKHLPPKIQDLYLGRYELIVDHINSSHIFHSDQELTLLLTMDKGGFIINEHMVSLGGMNECINDVKLLLNRIIVDKATKFIIAHNHPNGIAAFSGGDIGFTVKLLLVAKIIGCEFMDHLLFPYDREPVSMQIECPKIFIHDWIGIYDSMAKKFFPKSMGII